MAQSVFRELWCHHEGPTFMPSSKPHHLPKLPSPNTITLEVRALTYQFRGTQTFSPSQGTAFITQAFTVSIPGKPEFL